MTKTDSIPSAVKPTGTYLAPGPIATVPANEMKVRTAQEWMAFCCVVFLTTCSVHAEHVLRTLPLAGTWKFRLDVEDVGVAEKWFALQFDDTVQLPGTTDENHKGVKKDEQCIDRLSRVWYWKGPAWDMRGSREGDMRYYDLVGNLPWAMHNMWWQYRFSMDDTMLREKIYPLYLINIEQQGTGDVLKHSFERALGTAGSGQRQAMVQAHAGPIGTAQGLGDEALESLKRLQGDLYPNGLWYESPCIESTLALANIIQDMFIQSWSDPTKHESGPIRIFPAVPAAWKDVEFRDLRAEGAFLVSAKHTHGQTQWVRIKSLAGEPCRVRPGLHGDIHIKSDRRLKLKQISPGIYEIDMKKGDAVLLY